MYCAGLTKKVTRQDSASLACADAGWAQLRVTAADQGLTLLQMLAVQDGRGPRHAAEAGAQAAAAVSAGGPAG